MDAAHVQSTRRVIGISGDGPNNTGALVTGARADTIAKGIAINGLLITNDRVQPSGQPHLQDLDRYYAACIIGGPGPFLVAARDFKDFGRAIRRKLLFEIVDTRPHLGAPMGSDCQIMHPASLSYSLGYDICERRLRQR